MAALYTEELERLLMQVVSGRRMQVIGVFPADMLPSVDMIQESSYSCCCFAVNTDPSHRPGKHWVLFISSWTASAGLELEYFDSYGMQLELYRELHLSCLRNSYLSLIKRYNTVMLQDLTTTACGYYCVFFAYLRANGRSFAYAVRFLVSLSTSSVTRDKLVVRNVYAIVDCRSKPMCYSGTGLRQCCCSCV